MIFKTQSSDKQTYGMQNILSLVLKHGFQLGFRFANNNSKTVFIGFFPFTLFYFIELHIFFFRRRQTKMHFKNENNALATAIKALTMFTWKFLKCTKKRTPKILVQLVHFSHFSWLFTSELFQLPLCLIWLVESIWHLPFDR